jgi:hypothetical protein
VRFGSHLRRISRSSLLATSKIRKKILQMPTGEDNTILEQARTAYQGNEPELGVETTNTTKDTITDNLETTLRTLSIHPKFINKTKIFLSDGITCLITLLPYLE